MLVVQKEGEGKGVIPKSEKTHSSRKSRNVIRAAVGLASVVQHVDLHVARAELEVSSLSRVASWAGTRRGQSRSLATRISFTVNEALMPLLRSSRTEARYISTPLPHRN
ncbi:uncharacterized protein UDID_17075 [Ustilago sp. UG-2017a]|nr:uncharacterized protein UDID_17075 [Ustilago sp. UG-2017a]